MTTSVGDVATSGQEFVEGAVRMRAGDGSTDAPTILPERITVRGKFLYAGSEKMTVRGVTYGAFRPDADGNEYHDIETIERDFAAMADAGFNVVRIPHTTPPPHLLDIALRCGLRVMVGLSVEQHIGRLLDEPLRGPGRVEAELRERVRSCARHPALLCYALGNEIPASIVRFVGPGRVERFLRRMTNAVRDEDPDAIVTYVNYPTTEYLDLSFLDVLSMNVYLEDEAALRRYLARLQNIAGDRPLLLSEVGLDSLRNGEAEQARTLAWQIRAAAETGCVGTVLFSWTDEWYRGGEDVEDWAFGLTDRARRPKPALEAVRAAFATSASPIPDPPPSISVVLCSYNGGRTIGEAIDWLLELDYPKWELIVVDDGSTDGTAVLADRPGVRLIRAEHGGLSQARNLGLRAANGEIVAYIDDDAYPDPDWLAHLAHAFLTTDHAGIGGPNISPPTDGPVSQCVSSSPGNPTHVLLDDVEAEHIPGCNMAFRRKALEAIGGFDTRFHAAGDDVDVCWRLRDAGVTLGFAPGAVVWHHRRATVRTYLRQQVGYGRAEALLARKWRSRLGGRTRIGWHGTIYGGGHTRPLRLGRSTVYHGIWGQAPFQSMYQARPGRVASLLLAPRIGLWVLALSALSVMGLAYRPLLLALVPLLLVLLALGAQSVATARRATFPAETRRLRRRVHLVAMVTMLHVAQPMARLWGQLRPLAAPSTDRPERVRHAAPIPRRRMKWTADWQPIDERLVELEGSIERSAREVNRGVPDGRWDLEVRAGAIGSARMCLAAEDHKDRHQLVRVRYWPRIAGSWCALLGLLVLLFVITLAGPAPIAAGISGAALLAGTGMALHQCSTAVGAIATPLARDGFGRHVRGE